MLIPILPMQHQHAECSKTKTRHATIIGTPDQTETFLKHIRIPVDEYVERVQSALDMHPEKFHVNIVLLGDKKDVSDYCFSLYGKKVNYVAFISLSRMAIYISVREAKPKIIAHELGHAVAEQYFTERPPYKIHELLAQYAAKNY